MAETPADVKRDIELTRERISETLQQLEAKTNVMQIVKEHPWPALGVAFAAGFLLSGTRADVKAASATLVATQGTRSRVGTMLDDVVANLMGGLSLAFQQRVDSLVDELKVAIGGTQAAGQQQGARAGASVGTQRFADADVTPAATRGDGVAAAGTTGAAEARSALGGAASGGTAGTTGMGVIGNAHQSGGTISSAGSQGMSAGSDWSPQSANLAGNQRAD